MGHHYLSMARGQVFEIADEQAVSLKKYLYALRPILSFHGIEMPGLPPPTSVDTILADLALPARVSAEVTMLLEGSAARRSWARDRR